MARAKVVFQNTSKLKEEDVWKEVECSLDPQKHFERIHELADAGYDHIYIHQIGLNQEAFFKYYKDKILPELS